jgi:hypothetical protein
VRAAGVHTNPDAMKFTLDVTLPERLLANRGDDVDDPFARALLAIDGVVSVFGINDFVTVTRDQGADWDAIVGAVEDAAERYLPRCPGGPSAETVERARGLLRDAVRTLMLWSASLLTVWRPEVSCR